MCKRIFLLQIILIFSLFSFSQNDTLVKQQRPIDEFLWGMRVGVGYQNVWYTEVGLSYHSAGGDIVSPHATCFYSSFEFTPSLNIPKIDNIFGLKMGGEQTGHLLVGGGEFKYLFDLNNNSALFVTPKIGFGIFGSINIMYGYNLLLTNKNESFNPISAHQISIIINIDKYIF